MKRACVLVVMCCGMLNFVWAQHNNDAQIWENIYIEKNITKRLLARINQEGRISENCTRPGFTYFDIGVNYKWNKHVHFALAYVWVEKMQPTELWSPRHQAYVTVTLRQKAGQFLITDRQMVQWQVKDIYTSATGKYPEYYLRNKFSVKYEKNFRFQPYIAAEIYYFVNQPYLNWQYHFNRIRYFAGMYYHPNLINEFEVYYLIEKHFYTNNPPTNWVIGLGYAHSF